MDLPCAAALYPYSDGGNSAEKTAVATEDNRELNVKYFFKNGDERIGVTIEKDGRFILTGTLAQETAILLIKTRVDDQKLLALAKRNNFHSPY